MIEVTFDDVVQAIPRISKYIHQTPVMTSSTLNKMAGCEMHFKCENFQRMGAFKARGAHNAVLQLSPEELAKGVVTHSSGNHAAALAMAARNAGTVAYVVMPSNAPQPKIDSVNRWGGKITFCEPTLESREQTAARVQNETGAVMIHPFDNWQVIAGQGTAALEMLDSYNRLDAIITPVGGGGLLAGTVLVGKAMSMPIYGAEPQGADDAYRSLKSGQLQGASNVNTIADGLRTAVGPKPWEIIRTGVKDIVTVTDEAIMQAMQLVWEVMKIIIEPSCAVPVAALMQRTLPLQGKRVGVILSGGNVDLRKLPWM